MLCGAKTPRPLGSADARPALAGVEASVRRDGDYSGDIEHAPSGRTWDEHPAAASLPVRESVASTSSQAADRLFGGSELLTVLQRNLDELDEAVLEDQRMVRAFEEWRRCMRDRTGERFEDSEDVELEIQGRLARIVGPLPPGESAPGEFAALTPEGPYDPAALTRLRRLELKFADADVTCEEEHNEPVEDVVQKEKEKQFREDNAELLRRVKPGGGPAAG